MSSPRLGTVGLSEVLRALPLDILAVSVRSQFPDALSGVWQIRHQTTGSGSHAWMIRDPWLFYSGRKLYDRGTL